MIDDSPDLPGVSSDDPSPAGLPLIKDAAAAVVTLSFDDLLPDANGEIVVFGDRDLPHLSIQTDERVCDSGIAESHTTAAGVEVGGFAYYAFESGTKLYFAADVDLTITPAHG